MSLGLINLNSKEDLEKLSKEELINLIIKREQNSKELIENLINFTEEELIEYQKDLQLIKEICDIFNLAPKDGQN